MTRRQARAFIDSVVKLRKLVTDEQAIVVTSVYPAWKPEVNYIEGDRVLYNDILYKVITTHISQEDWTPDAAISLFTRVSIPDENIIPEWIQPESTNPYMIGDKVTYEGKTWESTVNDNVWAPNIYGWQEY